MNLVETKGKKVVKETKEVNDTKSLICGCPMAQQISMFGGTGSSR